MKQEELLQLLLITIKFESKETHTIYWDSVELGVNFDLSNFKF